MRIVKVLGGLGNQMFQFALYKALQKQYPEERVLLDLHCFNGYHKHRGFEIDSVFGVTYEKATLKEVASLAYPPLRHLWRKQHQEGLRGFESSPSKHHLEGRQTSEPNKQEGIRDLGKRIVRLVTSVSRKNGTDFIFLTITLNVSWDGLPTNYHLHIGILQRHIVPRQQGCPYPPTVQHKAVPSFRLFP